jgi:hypothetical protein
VPKGNVDVATTPLFILKKSVAKKSFLHRTIQKILFIKSMTRYGVIKKKLFKKAFSFTFEKSFV